VRYSYYYNELIAWVITKQGITKVYNVEVLEAKLERNIDKFHLACIEGLGDVEPLAL
jgi:hypothetical protein